MAAGARGRGAELCLISALILCLGDHDIRSENAKREIGISSLARATGQLCLELYSEIYTKRDFAMGRVLSRVVARRGQ